MTENAEEARSRHLSTVLEDIGVSKGVILLRRNTHITVELLLTAQVRLDGNDNDLFIFGSQSEGTTTIGMRSDTDVMFHKKMFRGVQDESDSADEKEYIPFRVLRNEKSSPQCCRLNLLSPAAPGDWGNNKMLGGDTSDFVSIHDGQTFLKTTFQLRELRQGDETRTRHGPAITIDDNTDYVKAFGTKLMKECKFVFDRFRPGNWPKASTMELAKQCLTFFVPQGPADRENRMIFDVKSKVVKFDVRVGIDDIVYSGEEFRFSTPTIERPGHCSTKGLCDNENDEKRVI